MSSNNSNKINVPQAKQAMDQFKMQSANEVGVNLKQGYNGHLTSREAGSFGGQMVKKICPTRTVWFARNCRTTVGHAHLVAYIAAVTLKSTKS